MENITPEQISIKTISQEEENNEPVLDTQKEEKVYWQRKKQCCSRRGHWRLHEDNINNENEGEEEGIDVPPHFRGRYHHGKFTRHSCRKNERKYVREEEEGRNDEEKEALNKQIRETKKQLKSLIIQKIQKRFPDCPPRKLHKLANRIMFHQFCQFGGLSPQCRLQCGMQPQGPQFWGGPIPWTPPQQRPCGFPACERQRRGHHEHCHRRRECVPPGAPFGKPCKISTYGPCGRQFGGLWKHPPYHRQFSGYFKRTSCKRPSPFTQFGGLCQRQPPLCFPWRRQFPGNFVDLCERPPQFGLFGGRGEKSPCHGYQCDQGRHHDMKRLRRWRRRITRSGPSPPRGQWGRPEFKQHGPEMRHWRRQV